MDAVTDVVEAEVQVAGGSVRYRRAGSGRGVLLVRARPGGAADPDFEVLSRIHRVHALLSPPPSRREEVERWLEGVVEGLGLASPDLYADQELAPLLSRLVARNGGVVGRVIFLPGTDAEGAASRR
jgi:hypothetical protein